MSLPIARARQLVCLLLTGLIAITLFPSATRAIDKTRLPPAGPEARDREPDARGADRLEPAERRRGGPADLQERLQPDGRVRGRWQLGIQAENTSTGVLVTRVVPNSVAWENGLERNDLIVTVDGFQVGLVGGRLYALEEELQIRGGRSGRVRLLVQDHRTGGLVNLDLRLNGDPGFPPSFPPRPQPPEQPRAGAIRGRVVYAGVDPRGTNAVLVVRLINISRPLGGLQPLAEQKFAVRGASPMPFALDFNPIQLAPGNRYALQVYILVNNRRVLANDPSQYTLETLDTTNVTVRLDAVRFDKQRSPDESR